MAISKVTKDLRSLLDAQNIPWEDHSGFTTERTWIPLNDGSVLCCLCSYYITPSDIEYGVTRGFPLKLEVSIIHSIDDYSSEAGMPKTPEEILEVLGKHGEK
jgi:hypothetical protein